MYLWQILGQIPSLQNDYIKYLQDYYKNIINVYLDGTSLLIFCHFSGKLPISPFLVGCGLNYSFFCILDLLCSSNWSSMEISNESPSKATILCRNKFCRR